MRGLVRKLAVAFAVISIVGACGTSPTPPPVASPTAMLSPTVAPSSTPPPVVSPSPALAAIPTAIAVGGTHACALFGDGTLKCWGDNAYGQLGNGTSTNPLSPSVVLVPPVIVVAGPGSASPLTGVSAIALGLRHTCALLIDATVKCWGWNSRFDDPTAITGSGGQLGDGTTIDRMAPVTVIAGPGSASPLTGVKAITAGWFHTCALLVDGTVKCWGTNWEGQLGDGTGRGGLAPVTAPVTVIAAQGSTSALSGVRAIAAGDLRTCALLADGTVKCWGSNYVSQLSDPAAGASGIDAAPVTVIDAGAPPVALSGVSAVAIEGGFTQGSGGFVACALVVSHTVKCWGANDNGALGDGTTTSSLMPVDVVGIPGEATAITAGCALLVDTTVTCWPGFSPQGDLLNAPFTVKAAAGSSDPLSGVTAIAAADAQTCALLLDGTVTCWKWNVPTPVTVLGLLATSPGVTPAPTATTGPTPGAGVPAPDGRIRLGATGYPGKVKPVKSSFVGNNVYNTTGTDQTDVEEFVGAPLADEYYSFEISIQNDAAQADKFTVKATGTAVALPVKYFHGKTDITSAIVAGNYNTPSLAPGVTYLITAKVMIEGGDVTRLVTITSLTDSTQKDTIEFGMKDVPCGC